MTDLPAAICVTFPQERDEQLAHLETSLVTLGVSTADLDVINAVARSVQSTKGGAVAFQLADLFAFAHGLKTVLDALRAARLEPGPEAVRVMRRATDSPANLARAARDWAASGRGWHGLLSGLRAVLQGASGDPAAHDAPVEVGLTLLVISSPPAVKPMEDDRSTVTFCPRLPSSAKADDPLPLLRERARRPSRRRAQDQRQMVIKRLKVGYGHMPGPASVTIPGDDPWR